VVSSRKTQDPNEKPAIGHISVDQTMELCVLHLKKQKVKSKQGMRNWMVRRNIRLKTMWATNEDSDDEVEEEGGSPERDMDENQDTVRQEHLLYRDQKSTHKYGLEKPLFLGGVLTVMQGIGACLTVDTVVPDGDNSLCPFHTRTHTHTRQAPSSAS
jgi:hypothetical protein